MSYCRTDGRYSQVYAYHDGKHIHIHVQASERIPGFRRSRSKNERRNFLRELQAYRPWQHPLAGKNYTVGTAAAAYKVMLFLRDSGVKVPKYALERLRKDAEAAV